MISDWWTLPTEEMKEGSQRRRRKKNELRAHRYVRWSARNHSSSIEACSFSSLLLDNLNYEVTIEGATRSLLQWVQLPGPFFSQGVLASLSIKSRVLAPVVVLRVSSFYGIQKFKRFIPSPISEWENLFDDSSWRQCLSFSTSPNLISFRKS